MGPRERRFVATMGRSVPAFEIVVGSADGQAECREIERLSLHHSGQPRMPEDEPELARFAMSFHGAVSIGGDGTAGAREGQRLARTGECAGTVVFTDRRAVGALVLGEFLGMPLDHEREQRAVMMSLDYSHLDSIELVSRRKVFGGRQPIGFQLSVVRPAIAGLRMEMVAETTLEPGSRRVDDLPARFERIVRAVCDRLLPLSSGASQDQLQRTLSGQYERSEDGDPVAIFQPEERSA